MFFFFFFIYDCFKEPFLFFLSFRVYSMCITSGRGALCSRNRWETFWTKNVENKQRFLPFFQTIKCIIKFFLKGWIKELQQISLLESINNVMTGKDFHVQENVLTFCFFCSYLMLKVLILFHDAETYNKCKNKTNYSRVLV